MQTYPKTAKITGEWREEGAEPYEGIIIGRWSGGVEWRATRATAERIVAEQAQMIAEMNITADEQDRLHWEGDVLVHTSGPAFEGTSDAYRVEYQPNPDGSYDIGFGWCWHEIPTKAQELHRLSVALEEFQRAARYLNAVWSMGDYSGTEIDGYPAHWRSFDEEALNIAAMRVQS